MRTVSSFNGQQRTTDKYSQASHRSIRPISFCPGRPPLLPALIAATLMPQELGKCERVQARGGVYQGIILGSMNSFFMFSYALALW